jgi:hypothetical protein
LGLKDRKAYKDRKEMQDHKDRKAYKDLKVIQDCKDHKAYKDSKETMAIWDQWDCKDQ